MEIESAVSPTVDVHGDGAVTNTNMVDDDDDAGVVKIHSAPKKKSSKPNTTNKRFKSC